MMKKSYLLLLFGLVFFGACENKKEIIKTEQKAKEEVPYYLKGYESYGVEPQISGDTINASKAAYEWYRDASFGMFIHWGVYSVEGKHEWEIEQRKWKVEDYEKLATKFKPTEFDAKEWVSIAKEAGMKYIVITSKHHDGFAMWDTQQSDWNIMDRTSYKKDIIKMLSKECEKQGIAFGLIIRISIGIIKIITLVVKQVNIQEDQNQEILISILII